MKNLIKVLKDTYKRISNNEYVRVFVALYLLGLLCFGICAFSNGFTLPISADYVLQTYAFYSQGYDIFWDFIKTGEFPLFDFSNFLGANYVGTQSFYYLFSPLFYLLCLWPRKFLYQGIFFHMVFKYALGGFFVYILLKKYFHVSKKMSWLGGFIYSFSGFTLFYLWFHFSDFIAVFPLFIIGIEKCLKERKGWLLSIGLCLCGLCNYVLFVNVCVFGIFYALYRWIYIYGINKKRGFDASTRWQVLIQGLLYCLAGVLLTGICMFPALYVVSTSTRTNTAESYFVELIEQLTRLFKSPIRLDNYFVLSKTNYYQEPFKNWDLKDILRNLFNILFVWQDRTVSSTVITGPSNIGYILSNWIYMNTNCWNNIMFSNAPLDNALGGFFITSPLTMLLIPSIVQTIKSKRPWSIFGMIICLVVPFLPITSYASFGFTNLYGRWQIWIVIIGIIYIIPTLDKFELVNRRWVSLNLFLNYSIAIIVYMISSSADKLPTADKYNIFGLEIPGFILVTIIELIVMLIVWFVYRFKIFKPAMVKKIMIIIAIVEVGASTVITVENKGYYKWEQYYLSQDSFSELQTIVQDIQDNDDGFYRIMNTEATRLAMNMPSTLNYAGASTFNSTYDFELDDFKTRSRMAYGGSWSMGNHEKRYWLDQYIGTKYYIIDKKDPNNDNAQYHQDLTTYFDGRTSSDEAKQAYHLNLGWNYQLFKEYEYYDVYENKDFIGIGYLVDNMIDSKNVGLWNEPTYYEELYSDTAILDSDTIDEIFSKYENINKLNYYNKEYETIYYNRNNFDLYFSPREYVDRDLDRDENGNITYIRHQVKISGNNFTVKEIKKYLPSNEQFLHKRWEEKNRFGDQFIYELKDGKKYAEKASDENIAYVVLPLKLGPRVLLSFYNDDVLITQDAHMNSQSSNYINEFKNQRGYYLNQPFNKIVIEFVADTSYSQAFSYSNGVYSSFENMNCIISYQNDIEKKQEVINNNKLYDVTYKNNTFNFKSNSNVNKIVVTNIPYDVGWTLKENGVKKDYFKVNGGFIGFVCNTGVIAYELSYMTPNIKEGIVTTSIGLLLYIALYFVYRNKKISILMCEKQISDIYLNKQLEEEEKYFANLEKKKNNFKEKVRKFFKRK